MKITYLLACMAMAIVHAACSSGAFTLVDEERRVRGGLLDKG